MRLWLAVALVLALDLGSKHIVFSRLGEPAAASAPQAPVASWSVIPGLLEFRTQRNEGAAMGFLAGQRLLFILAAVAAVPLFLVLFAQSGRRQWFFQLGVGMVLGGALGNLYDRILIGHVRDFIHVVWRIDADLWQGWPRDGVYPWVFNVADIGLVVGVIAMMAGMMRRRPAAAPAKARTELEKRSSRR